MSVRRAFLTVCLVGGLLGLLPLSGCATKYLAFTTATKFALDISQKADQTIDVSLGYDRVEVACVPAPESDTKSTEDTYSVLGTFFVDYGNPWTDEPFHLNQFLATGWAASTAAGSAPFQRFFASKAADIQNKAREADNDAH